MRITSVGHPVFAATFIARVRRSHHDSMSLYGLAGLLSMQPAPPFEWVGKSLGQPFASALCLRKAASPASDTSIHFGSGAESAS